MNTPGLSRADLVFLNRMNQDYLKQELPHPEQIRADMAKMLQLAQNLDGQIEKMSKRDA